MGNYTYLKANTHIKKDQLTELGYLITGMTGQFAHPHRYEDDINMGCFECFPSGMIDFEINEKDEIVLTSSAKWTTYQDAKLFRFGEFNTIERIASYLGGCEVRVYSEEGITPPPLAKNGVYEYTTPLKEQPVELNADTLKKQMLEYNPFLINTELLNRYQDKYYKGMSPYDANFLVRRNFTENIKSTVQLANVTAFLCYRGKESLDFTKEEVFDYLKRDNSAHIAFGLGISQLFGENVMGKAIPAVVTSKMRCEGMKEFFQSIGRNDLANVVKDKEEFLERKERMLAKEKDFKSLLTTQRYNNIYEWAPESKYWNVKDKYSVHQIDENTAITLTKYDYSDFFHFKFESEIQEYPFGSESISVTILPNERVSFTYNNKETLDKIDKKYNSNTLYKVLDKINNPAFLKNILERLTYPETELSLPKKHYISDSEIQSLQDKIPILERGLDEQKRKVFEFLQQDYIFLNVPYSEKEEAKNLGASWSSNKKAWYVKKSDDLEKFEKWLPDAVKEELTQKDEGMDR